MVIIGGGFAGLCAGTALAENGVRVLVLDARPRLGGRATAFPDRQTGELVDNGQHVMFGCYRETMRFLERIGARGNVHVQEALQLPFLDRRGTRSVLRTPSLPPPWHLVAGVMTWTALPWQDRLSVLRLARPLRAAATAVPSEMTVYDWLRAHRQRPRIIEWLWEPLALAALNQPIDQARAEPFVRILREMFAPDRTASALVLPLKPLDQTYANPARDFIERRGGAVRTDALARVVTDGSRITAVQVRDEQIPADCVISTVAWHQLRTLFETVPAAIAEIVRDADEMQSMPIVTVNLWYDRVIMDDPFVGLPGRSMQWIFDKRRVFGESASHLSLVSSAAAQLAASSTQDLIDLAAREVADALPAAHTARVVRGTVIREKHATFSLAAGQPPRPRVTTPLGGFYLAGDWVETGLPGTIESAAMSGHLAARAILNAER